MLDKFNNFSYNYQSKIGYDTLTQNVILTEIINIMGITLVDIETELKMKFSRANYSESNFIIQHKFFYLIVFLRIKSFWERLKGFNFDSR